MTARCPFCEAVHPIEAVAEPTGQQIHCPCRAVALLCAPNTEPETSVLLAEMGLSDTKADVRESGFVGQNWGLILGVVRRESCSSKSWPLSQ
jgi:hypothetical protein